MVLPTATGTFPLPWVLQDLWALSGRRLPSRQVVISLSRAVHWPWGEHPWSRHWVMPAPVGRELGAEAPSGLGVQRTTEQLRVDGSTLGGNHSWEPTCHVWVTGFATTENKQ